jgi:hypothetical protein
MASRITLGCITIVVACIVCTTLYLRPPTPTRVHREIDTTGPFNLTLSTTAFRTTRYYHRATYTPDRTDDVCLVVQSSLDRLERVLNLAQEWHGPISVAIYVNDDQDLSSVDSLVLLSSEVANFMDIHLLYFQQVSITSTDQLLHSRASDSLCIHLMVDALSCQLVAQPGTRCSTVSVCVGS